MGLKVPIDALGDPEPDDWTVLGTPGPLPIPVGTWVRFRHSDQHEYCYGKVAGYTTTPEVGTLDHTDATTRWGRAWLYHIDVDDLHYRLDCGFSVNSIDIHAMWVEEVTG